MRCLNCGTSNPDAQKFCGDCGTRLPSEGLEQVPRGQRSYTPPHLADRILSSRSALEGERKQVTVLFCDIANSTPLAARIGPDRMHKVLNAFFETALGMG
jgi:class 3 adenylate cyclase